MTGWTVSCSHALSPQATVPCCHHGLCVAVSGQVCGGFALSPRKVVSSNPTPQAPGVQPPCSAAGPSQVIWPKDSGGQRQVSPYAPIVILIRRVRVTLGRLPGRFICGDFQILALGPMRTCVCVCV